MHDSTTQSSPAKAAARLQALQACEYVREQVEPATWEAFLGTVIEGRSVEEVAAELEMSRNAVYIAKSRCLRLLRQ